MTPVSRAILTDISFTRSCWNNNKITAYVLPPPRVSTIVDKVCDLFADLFRVYTADIPNTSNAVTDTCPLPGSKPNLTSQPRGRGGVL